MGKLKQIRFPEIEILYCRDGDNYIAYVPSRGVIFRISDKAYHVFCDISKNKINRISKNYDLVLSRLHELENIPALISHTKYHPLSQLVLLLTNDCNMRCIYCYSEGGKKKAYISFKAAKTVIDYTINNLLEQNLQRLNLSFHGGGEPTLAWNILRSSYKYAKNQCKDNHITLRTRLTSNGIWTNDQAKWIANNIDSVLLSMDGPEDIMRVHRPTANGLPSLPLIIQSINYLKEKKNKIKIRATISDKNVNRLPEIVEYFSSLGASFIQLEPLALVGRASINGVSRPDPDEFCAQFLLAVLVGKKNNCKVKCSYFRPIRHTNEFCGALGRILILTPKGNISTCHRIESNEDVGAQDLLIGKIVCNDGSVYINPQKLLNLTSIRSTRPEGCEQCIAKYSCSGGCYIQNASITGTIVEKDPYRCQITKNLTKSFFKDFLHNSNLN